MSMKKMKALLIGSPLVIIQVAIFIYMTVFGLQATFQAFDSSFLQWSYCIGIIYSLVLTLVALFRTFTTEPGAVTPALLEKLKNQLLLPKQLEKLDTIRGDMNQRQYLVKCMNSAIAKHIARRPNSALNQISVSIQADMELLELQPTSMFEAQRGTSVGRTLAALPEVCKFTYCEACEQIMPPRSEHCESCNQCTLRVDHHCIWIGNNCVGLLNHKFFMLYLFYVVYLCVQIAGPFIVLFFFKEDDEDSLGVLEILSEFPNEFISYALASALLIGVGFMLVYQVVILLLNKTTMEVTMDAKRNPFRHSGVVRNIEMVFGSRKLVWLSPFHDPFPDMKLVGYTPSQRQLMRFGVPVANPTSGSRGLDYVQCIIPTIRSTM